MLRILSSKIFREDISEYSLPIWAFEDFEDIEKIIDAQSKTYKFCLPVSIGDFPETNVPACFSNNLEELRNFVNIQKTINHRKAFILSDFQISDLMDIYYSGVINTYSKKGISDFYDKTTTISITFKNPILTYIQEKISPRDLKPDIQISYDHISNPNCAFPTFNIKNNNFDINLYKNIIYQAYMASVKIHEAAESYDGKEYNEHSLFFVNNEQKIKLYEIIGEESFLGKNKNDLETIKRELNYLKLETETINNRLIKVKKK